MPKDETKRILEKAAKPNFQFYRGEQVSALEHEAAAEREKAKDARTYSAPQFEQGLVTRRLQQIQKDLEEYRPPEVSKATRDELIRESDRLVDEIRDGMPTTEVMDRNPPGAVHHHTEHSRANKEKILKWKNLQKVIHPDSDDPDLCNFEKHRPSLSFSGANTTFMADAQLSGHLALSEEAKKNFPESMGQNTNSALEQVLNGESGEEED